jgi:hypothetical protein
MGVRRGFKRILRKIEDFSECLKGGRPRIG